jgi:6-phosphogluconolactonase
MKKVLLAMASVFVMSSFAAAQDQPGTNLHAGAVYVMSNQTVNTVIAFSRNPRSGSLTFVEEEATGGAGDPVPIPPDPPIDPLASQGAIAVDGDNEFVYAVNAGSHEISVLRVETGGLTFVQKVSSGGTRPISLTIFGSLLYVLNEGGTPNITGFNVAEDGTLTPIAGSTQPLIGGGGADPAQVSFNADGTVLVVTEKAGNRLDTYVVDVNGVAGPPTANASAGMTPFGFAFVRGHLVVSEAFGGTPGASAASSYDVSTGGVLSVVSASVPNGQTANCWVVSAGSLAITSNTASDTLSSYRVSDAGTLTLLNGVAANTGAGSAPVDMAVSNNKHFLYVLENGSHVVSAYRIGNPGHHTESADRLENHGSRGLTLIGEFGTIPAGAQGIASK